jgi:hypothetical protein
MGLRSVDGEILGSSPRERCVLDSASRREADSAIHFFHIKFLLDFARRFRTMVYGLAVVKARVSALTAGGPVQPARDVLVRRSSLSSD